MRRMAPFKNGTEERTSKRGGGGARPGVAAETSVATVTVVTLEMPELFRDTPPSALSCAPSAAWASEDL